MFKVTKTFMCTLWKVKVISQKEYAHIHTCIHVHTCMYYSIYTSLHADRRAYHTNKIKKTHN